ncbi:stage II sporulation protein P [Solibacillus kalamii]|uniref:Stage II sporulation protein P n=1 Tax=Solibacillus kalamii TaxID=1748298 RepID=A0ABX3ZH30_9BACL|nr:stage II sporulation protein P [Solibacillus kalamii]MBM7663720.1 stage II sporulation protein P [Solibacillus kalamii]OUZ39031.1 stage II sporulation protein P [Solibacillus kalamii]
MQNDKELFNMIKKAYPQNPSKEFITETENKLRRKAENMKIKGAVRRTSAIYSGVLLFTLAFSWLFLFSGKEVITNVLSNHGDKSLSTIATNENNPLVFIYQSHNQEAYNVKVPNEAFRKTDNVTMVGMQLSKALEEKNIFAIHDDTDIFAVLEERNLTFKDSYNVSRENLQETLKKHTSIEMVLDIHRDSQERKFTTVNIDGKDYAKIGLVVSKISDNYKENREFANHLHQKLEKLYPGISRGVIEKGENPRNTYNQEIQKQSVLLNIGGTENTMEEAFRATDALAEAIKEIVQEP